MADTTYKLVLPSLDPRKLIVAYEATSRSDPAEARSPIGKGESLMETPKPPVKVHGQRML